MSISTLSRRAILAGASASALTVPIAAVAVAAPSLALAEPAIAVPTVPSGPSVIEKLWDERQAALREYEAAHRVCDRLDKVLEQRMPDPHPSIVWSNPENDADGLKFEGKGEPWHLKKYIHSRHIERVLKAACEPKFLRTKIEGKVPGTLVVTWQERSKDEGPFAFTEEDVALQERLRARMELSRRYERKMKRVSHEIGLTAAERRRDRACSRQVKIDNKIIRIPASSRRDLAIKIEIFDHYERDMGADEIVRDVRRLIVMPDELRARMLASVGHPDPDIFARMSV